jgi:integrase
MALMAVDNEKTGDFRTAVDKAIEQAIRKDRKGQAIPETLRFHDLRHTCAALLIANGRHMEEVKDHLGHGSIRVTSDRYGHLWLIGFWRGHVTTIEPSARQFGLPA